MEEEEEEGPALELALRALSEDVLHATAQHVGEVLRLRDQVGRWLRDLDGVRTVYASEANFFLVRCDDPDALLHTLGAAGIVVRDMRHLPGLHDALRITIGTGPEMAALREALTASSSPTTSTDISTDTSTEESPA